ncbi:MAG TPA: bifunctional phosphoribosylaminoimidazolecarboxamide formyltransferase/IMP cyclohydrolase [Candidatus Limnocylindrales bacterium]|nr:bifunctional phosphoribosylaminoimidazolecarboxamide formyltransferase/IMP cyclohydrolase [Candidatus Limnocylindrales bacterium]
MRALLSVADRQGLAPFARGLASAGVELFATDGTREALAADGLEAAPISDLTAVPPLAGGQVKTFHPAVYAGILARRDRPEQLAELVEHGIAPIDLVVVNVSPFAPQVGARMLSLDEAVERIDVGGVALLSAAARNYAGVAAVCAPDHYPAVLAELRERGVVSPELRQRLAAEAFATVAAYNAEVAAYLNHIGRNRFPRQLTLVLERVADLPYGENPQQQAAFYRETSHRSGTLADAARLQGGQQTFNDLLDLDAAFRIVSDFTAPTVAIVKRGNPVGLASNDDLAEAYARALAGDPVDAFGATLAVNRPLDEATARHIVDTPYESVVAPGADPAAQLLLAEKPELAVLVVPSRPGDGLSDYGIADLDFARVSGGLLVETVDRTPLDRAGLRVVTRRRPTLEELTDLMFAWRAVRHVRSNAVVLARNSSLVGVGAGQASRLVAVEICLHRAAERAKMSVLASDAYFPFADAIQLAAERGVTAIIQPGGSRRDAMAIEVADRHHMAMVFTGRRSFRH